MIIPESVEEIGRDLLFFSTEVEKVRFPDNLEVMNDFLCAECWKIKEVNIPSKVREIYSGIFYGCPKAPASIAVLPETVEILDGDFCIGIPSIESVVVPPNVRIMKKAFYGVPNLKKVTIQTNKLTEIGEYAFYNCDNLEDINIPDGVTRIGNSAFYCNFSLRKINIPSSVTYIAENAFACTHLDSIDIPAGVTFIGRGAFWKCDRLKKVYSRPVIPPVTNAWSPPHLPFESDATETCTLFIPKGSAKAYRASEVFSGFKNIVELEDWQWPTSISTPTMPTDAYKVYGKDGTLHIETIGGAHDPAFVNVYNINGQVVWKGQVSKRMEVPLPQGVYVVKIGKRNYKISL